MNSHIYLDIDRMKRSAHDWYPSDFDSQGDDDNSTVFSYDF